MAGVIEGEIERCSQLSRVIVMLQRTVEQGPNDCLRLADAVYHGISQLSIVVCEISAPGTRRCGMILECQQRSITQQGHPVQLRHLGGSGQ